MDSPDSLGEVIGHEHRRRARYASLPRDHGARRISAAILPSAVGWVFVRAFKLPNLDTAMSINSYLKGFVTIFQPVIGSRGRYEYQIEP